MINKFVGQSESESTNEYEYSRSQSNDMSTEVSVEDVGNLDTRTTGELDERAVAEQLQQVYEYVLDDRRPEAVGATEQLAEQLGVEVERPERSPSRADR